MPSEYLPCVECNQLVQLPASLVKKKQLDSWICDPCGFKLQERFRNMTDEEMDRIVAEVK